MLNLQKIKDLAKAQGISIRALADAVGLKENQMHVMMRTNSTKLDTLEKIANVLNVPITIFLSEDVDKNSQTMFGDGQQIGGSGVQTKNTLNQGEHDELIRLRVEVKMLQERLNEAQKAYENLQKSYAHLQKMNEFLMGNK